ncbi:MAG: sigma factor-like helix-turn-helix DNA-binding protein, partial [Patescibacteria group bacterium]
SLDSWPADKTAAVETPDATAAGVSTAEPALVSKVEEYVHAAGLTLQEDFVIRRRYGLPVNGVAYGPLTLSEIGHQAKYALSKTYNLEQSALRKLRSVALDLPGSD